MTNGGHTFVVNGPSPNSLGKYKRDTLKQKKKVLLEYNSRFILVSGCCLANSYQFAQFHMHWGATDADGSEHLIDGRSYSAEVKLIQHET